MSTCGFCQGGPVGNAATWLDDRPRGPAPCPRCGEVYGYPLRWRHEARGGYGYVELVPCRVVREGPKRVQISALRADGSEALRWVAYESLRASSGGPVNVLAVPMVEAADG